MKKLSLYIFLVLMISNASFANNFVYNCNLNTKYKNGIDGDWKQKYVKFTFSNSNDEKVKVFDHEIDGYYSPDMTIITNNEEFIYAIKISSFNSLGSLSINKKNKYAQISFLSGSGGTTVHFGYCK